MLNLKPVLAIAVVVALAGCSSVSTQPDEQALHYKGGSFSSKKFADCVEPSDRQWDGPGDGHFIYPAGQRTFSFTGREGSESSPIVVKTNDSQEMSVPGFVTFELTQDCAKLREFHEQVGSKYKAFSEESGKESGGWRTFLNDYIAVPLNSSMDKAALQTDWRTLYSSADSQAEFEQYVKENLPREVQAAIGDDFLTIKAVSIETPVPSEGLRKGLEAREQAKLDNEAQKERNATARTKYDTFRDCMEVLGEQSCLILNLAESGDVPFYPIPDGSGFLLPGEKADQ